ncbi:MAG: OadG family protein [Saccharospirillum sp.]|nr:OadG family protein [Saccharospirillum sp.]
MSDLLQEGLNLMLMGMGTVFVFLTVLVIGTTLMSKLVGLTTSQSDIDSKARSQSTAAREDLTELAAVAAAVKVIHER